uniref:ACB domain-containing protein n=1 Tax=Neogobius melanostomus TaxID=47308 RepID=A0A8C6SHW3_9GOBI
MYITVLLCASTNPYVQEAFYQAAEEAKVLKQKPDKSELTFLYGLYKQATLGDVNTGEFMHLQSFIFFIANLWWWWLLRECLDKGKA